MTEEHPDVELDGDEAEAEAIEDGDGEGDGDGDGGQTTEAAAQRDGSDQVAKNLERAITGQKKRLEKILDVDLDGHECPTCDGMGYLQQPREPEPQLVHAANLVKCEPCDGFGLVVTGSRHPDHSTALCTNCAGNGFVTETPQAVLPNGSAPLPVPTAGPIMGTMQPDGTFIPFATAATA